MEIFIQKQKATRSMRKHNRKKDNLQNQTSISGSCVLEGLILLILFIMPLYLFIKSNQPLWAKEVSKYEFKSLP